MAKVEVYTSPLCGYCHMALRLLDSKNVDYEKIGVLVSQKNRSEMEQRSQRHTVPQIFINDQSIGGCDELFALEKQGKLNALLAAAACE